MNKIWTTVLGGFNNAFTVLVTDVLKLFVGKARPHLLSVCNLTEAEVDVMCSDVDDNVHVTDCHHYPTTALINAQLSFPSGHASAVCATCVFLIVSRLLMFRILNL